MVKISKYILIIILIVFSFFSFSQTRKTIKDRKATYYHNKFVNRKTSSGEVFDQRKYTAAHKTIALNSLVRVVNKDNNRSVVVRINDRCPKRGVIDLSLIAAKRLKMLDNGVTNVSIELLSNDYINIWEKQDEIFNMFDRMEENDSILNAYFDSIIFQKENELQSSLLFTTYIRILTVESKYTAKEIISTLPEKYRYITKVVKSNNNKFYHINIGPFLSLKTAKNIVDELEENYPKIRILENKIAE